MQKTGLIHNREKYGASHPVRRTVGEALAAGGISFVVTVATTCTFAASLIAFGCGVLSAVAVNVAEYYLRGLKYPSDIFLYRRGHQNPGQTGVLLEAVESLLRGEEKSLEMTDGQRIGLAGRILKTIGELRPADDYVRDELLAITDRYEDISGQISLESPLVLEILEDDRLSYERHLELLKREISFRIYKELFFEERKGLAELREVALVQQRAIDGLSAREKELEEAVDQLHRELLEAMESKLKDS